MIPYWGGWWNSANGPVPNEVMNNNPDAVVSYKAGKATVIMFLVGQVMKDMKGKAQPEKVKDILEKKLS